MDLRTKLHDLSVQDARRKRLAKEIAKLTSLSTELSAIGRAPEQTGPRTVLYNARGSAPTEKIPPVAPLRARAKIMEWKTHGNTMETSAWSRCARWPSTRHASKRSG
jgi:hypothetical protein